MKLKCIITDDEPLAIEGIARYIKEVDFLENVGACSNPIELDNVLRNQPVDLIFLDIQMPLMNGLEYLKMNPTPPMVIITTAFPSYALEGYNFDVLDYLVKPITFSRFFKAVNKARSLYLLQNKVSDGAEKTAVNGSDYFYIKCENKYERIYTSEILYVQALENYVTIFTTKTKYITLLPLKTVEEYLSEKLFIKTHKSFLVAIEKIETIENHEISIKNHKIPISRNFKDLVFEKVLKENLIKK